jgi:hypothetical protein
MSQAFNFMYTRDYEATNQRSLRGEFLISFDEGEDADANGSSDDAQRHHRSRGAYYTVLHKHQTLRKRRPRVCIYSFP